MADELPEGSGDTVPPVSEYLHLPGPSALPVFVALGVTIALVGIVFSWVVLALGLLIALGAIFSWVKDTRRDIAELPLEH